MHSGGNLPNADRSEHESIDEFASEDAFSTDAAAAEDSALAEPVVWLQLRKSDVLHAMDNFLSERADDAGLDCVVTDVVARQEELPLHTAVCVRKQRPALVRSRGELWARARTLGRVALPLCGFAAALAAAIVIGRSAGIVARERSAASLTTHKTAASAVPQPLLASTPVDAARALEVTQPPVSPALTLITDVERTPPEPVSRAAVPMPSAAFDISAVRLPPLRVAPEPPITMAVVSGPPEPGLPTPRESEAPISLPPAPAAIAPVAANSNAAASAAVDQRAINGTLERYRVALSTLNAEGARQVWPTIDARGLTRAFDQLAAQELTFKGCDVAIDGVQAVAECHGYASYVPRVGNRTPRVESRRWRFQLRRSADDWVIANVSAR
jgi:hypothetical protein